MARTSWSIVMLIGLCGIGCQSLASFEFSTLWEDRAPVGKPDQVSAFWVDGVDVKPDPTQGGVLIPGFAGRIVFMRTKQSDTVAVSAPITIQAYISSPNQNQAIPLEQWTIQPDHLPLLFKRDIAGWGYTVWLPWNSYSPEIKQVRLIVVYQEKDQAAPLYSEAMTVRVQDPTAKTPIVPTPLNPTHEQKVFGGRLQ
jgi:hypothetical protein